MLDYALDYRTATARFPGIGRYTNELAGHIPSLLHPDERLLLLHTAEQRPPQTAQMLSLPVRDSPFATQQQWRTRRQLQQHAPATYHSPYYLLPYFSDRPLLLTVHDLIPQLFPDVVSARARLLFRFLHGLAVRRAAKVIAVSHATRRDLLRHTNVAAAKVEVIHSGVDDAFQPQSQSAVQHLRSKYSLPQRFMLYLGINKPHKNLQRLIEALTQVEDHAPLIIAGAWDPRYPEPKQLAATLNLEQRVRFLGRIDAADLAPLYSSATLFVFPSIYEGFGLPPLEAMACGTPVACADRSSLPEIVGDAALLFDPDSTQSIAAALTQMLEDRALRQQLRERGLERAAHFTWERAARQTLSLYRALATN